MCILLEFELGEVLMIMFVMCNDIVNVINSWYLVVLLGKE